MNIKIMNQQLMKNYLEDNKKNKKVMKKFKQFVDKLNESSDNKRWYYVLPFKYLEEYIFKLDEYDIKYDLFYKDNKRSDVIIIINSSDLHKFADGRAVALGCTFTFS